MITLFQDSVSKTLNTFLDVYESKIDYKSFHLQLQHICIWNCKQFILGNEIFNRTCVLIENSPYEDEEIHELIKILKYLFDNALPFYVLGMDKNPIHHNLQVVENIVQIVIGEKESFQFARMAAILALLHDVGNGFVDPKLAKIKSSDIKDHVKNLYDEGRTEDEIDRETEKEIKKAILFRKAHMIEGVKIADRLIDQLNKDNDSMRGIVIENMKEITNCIEIHDNPSIADHYSQLDKNFNKSHLIPLNNPLAVVLREADRLWMVSKEGLEKDLFDDLKKKIENKAIEKLRHNLKRFVNEYNLYCKANEINSNELSKFKGKTLFRTATGYRLLKKYLKLRLLELDIEYHEDDEKIIPFILDKAR
ncbi:MAG: hypothetical protein GY839_13345 [candidate division Zixibacteria bacterium]|nr:hypothetical protein [candidate division Zixibacteria bacterium]